MSDSEEARHRTIREIWDIYRSYTDKLSTISRQLAFSNVAICWLFKFPDNNLPTLVLLALLFAILFFIADITQYIIGALVHKKLAKNCEKKSRGSDLNQPCPKDTDMDVYTEQCLKSKVTFLLISYFLLLIYFIRIV